MRNLRQKKTCLRFDIAKDTDFFFEKWLVYDQAKTTDSWELKEQNNHDETEYKEYRLDTIAPLCVLSA